MQIHGEMHGEQVRLIDCTGSQGRSTTHPDTYQPFALEKIYQISGSSPILSKVPKEINNFEFPRFFRFLLTQEALVALL